MRRKFTKKKNMNNEKNPHPQQLQIDLSPEIAKGVYSNFQIISHSNSEFVIDFASLLPGVPKAMVSSRVIISPEHAKSLLSTLNDNIVRYEAEFGKIEPPKDKKLSVAPFGIPKEQA